jgi:hypothetical protein
MLRPAMTTIDISGDWQGHYEQNRRQHGISMHVVQRGQSFVGAMRDAVTLLASTERLRAMRGSGAGATDTAVQAEVLSSMPEHSTVEGEVEDRLVTFVKSYRGVSSTNVWVAGKAKLKIEAPGHQVHYRGTLAANGNEFAGYWTIPAAKGGTTLRGRFLLRRDRASGSGAQ